MTQADDTAAVPLDDGSRRPRRHRRVVAAATNASPGETPDFSEPHVELDETESAGPGPEIGSDDWWRAQRPPHWG